MFSSRPQNRRRRSWKSSKTKDNILDTLPADKKTRRGSSPKSPREKAHQLNAQIGALEQFLAQKKQSEATQLRMRKENILPPPERRTKPVKTPSMSMAERRRYLQERNKTGLRFLLLFLIACGMGWWLIFAGI